MDGLGRDEKTRDSCKRGGKADARLGKLTLLFSADGAGTPVMNSDLPRGDGDGEGCGRGCVCGGGSGGGGDSAGLVDAAAGKPHRGGRRIRIPATPLPLPQPPSAPALPPTKEITAGVRAAAVEKQASNASEALRLRCRTFLGGPRERLHAIMGSAGGRAVWPGAAAAVAMAVAVEVAAGAAAAAAVIAAAAPTANGRRAGESDDEENAVRRGDAA